PDAAFAAAPGDRLGAVLNTAPQAARDALLDGLDGDDVARKAPDLAYRRRVQMVFQDPFASLNPAHTIGHHIERPLAIHGRAEDPKARTREILASVGVPPHLADKRPSELSGGQRQRVAIARALAVEPDVLVADEPTSMLDVSLRAGVLELFARERRDRGLSCLLVTHDLSAARAASDRMCVLYAGVLVESGPTEDVLLRPAHPYTQLLVAAARGGDLRTPLPARPGRPVLVDPPPGCPFAARCPSVTDRCRATMPAAHAVGPGRVSRCHLAEAA
ncbi:MAG: ABC transporter ATP-binding protein, partial [Myxococcota bacterium]